jgi:hypothetical protein
MSTSTELRSDSATGQLTYDPGLLLVDPDNNVLSEGGPAAAI